MFTAIRPFGAPFRIRQVHVRTDADSKAHGENMMADRERQFVHNSRGVLKSAAINTRTHERTAGINPAQNSLNIQGSERGQIKTALDEDNRQLTSAKPTRRQEKDRRCPRPCRHMHP